MIQSPTLCDKLLPAYRAALDRQPDARVAASRRNTIDHFEIRELGVVRICWNDGYPFGYQRIPLDKLRQLRDPATAELDVERMIKEVAMEFATCPSGSVGTHLISPLAIERLCHACVPSEVWGNTRDPLLDEFGIHDFYWELDEGDLNRAFVSISYYSKLPPKDFNQRERLMALGKYIESLTEDVNHGVNLIVKLVQGGLNSQEASKIANELWQRAGRRDFIESCRTHKKNMVSLGGLFESVLIDELMKADKATEEGKDLFAKVLSDNRTDDDIKAWVTYWKAHL